MGIDTGALDTLIQDLFDAIFVFLAGLFAFIADLFSTLVS
jgi:hypothetical protein